MDLDSDYFMLMNHLGCEKLFKVTITPLQQYHSSQSEFTFPTQIENTQVHQLVRSGDFNFCHLKLINSFMNSFCHLILMNIFSNVGLGSLSSFPPPPPQECFLGKICKKWFYVLRSLFKIFIDNSIANGVCQFFVSPIG